MTSIVQVDSCATFAAVLDRRAELDPDKIAYTFLADGEREAESITFGQLRQRAHALATRLSWLNARAQRALLVYPQGLEFIVAGPLKAEVIALQKDHDAFLKKPKKEPAALAAFTDASVANLSSLVMLAKVGNATIFLTGDARGDKILTGMKAAKLLKGAGSKLHVDILKVPHHGSDRNMETGFFEQVTSDHYVFSGNGEHGNPERETLEMLWKARGDAKYTVHLTYPVDEIDPARKVNWGHEQDKENARKAKNPSVKVRPNWSAPKHSVHAFLSATPAFAKKLKIVPPDKPHVIDLLDPLGF